MERCQRRSDRLAAFVAAGLALGSVLAFGAFAQDGKKPKDPKEGKKPQDEKPAGKAEEKPDYELKNAKGSAYFLDHSPEDVRCKFEYVQKAQERLKKEGAAVELVTYKGGHGWTGDPFTRLTAGFAWMEKNHGKPERK